MDIRVFLLILNTVVIFLAPVVYATMKIGSDVTEINEEQAHKERRVLGWYVASIAIGALALPLMLIREIWRWKRDKSSRFEWGDVGRCGMIIVAGCCLHFCLLLLTSCSATKPVTAERIVYKTDTLYKTNVRADTFRILDSVFVNQYAKGDTIYKEKTSYKWRDKVSVRVDTLYKNAIITDSVRMPIPVVRELSAWEKTSMRVGKLTIGVVVTVAILMLLWLIHRKK